MLVITLISILFILLPIYLSFYFLRDVKKFKKVSFFLFNLGSLIILFFNLNILGRLFKFWYYPTCYIPYSLLVQLFPVILITSLIFILRIILKKQINRKKQIIYSFIYILLFVFYFFYIMFLALVDCPT